MLAVPSMQTYKNENVITVKKHSRIHFISFSETFVFSIKTFMKISNMVTDFPSFSVVGTSTPPCNFVHTRVTYKQRWFVSIDTLVEIS